MPPSSPKISFITTVGVNIGDEFIREGICSFLDEIFPQWTPYYINKHDLSTLYQRVYEEPRGIGDKIANADMVIQAGAPVYWKLGSNTCYNVDWADELWNKRIFQFGPAKPILNIAAGACQPYPDFAKTFLSDPACVEFAQNAARACRWTSVRDPLASQILYALNIPHEPLPCAAFHAARRCAPAMPETGLVGINLMPLGGHFRLKEDVDDKKWLKIVSKVVTEIRRHHRIIFIAHDHQEKKFMEQIAASGENVFYSNDYQSYFNAYSRCSIVLANRVHGAVCAAGFGIPALIVGNDSRLQIGDFIGLPALYVGDSTAEAIIDAVRGLISSQKLEKERLLTLREESAVRYVASIRNALDGDTCFLDNSMKSLVADKPARLSVLVPTEQESLAFTDFLTTLNHFANRNGLDEVAFSKERWSYPWLWFNACSGRDWSQLKVLDLASGANPLPWFIAAMGAKVTLTTWDSTSMQKWEQIKKLTGLDVDWKLLQGEDLPIESDALDLVICCSALDRLHARECMTNEVLRVLKRSGTFAFCFYVNSGTTETLGADTDIHAFTTDEFEKTVWKHPGFLTSGDPLSNIEKGVDDRIDGNDNCLACATVLHKKVFDDTAIFKILLPRFDSLGDIILLGGFIQALLDKFPKAEVTLLVREGYEHLAPLFPQRLKWKTQPYSTWIRHDFDDLEKVAKTLKNIADESWDLVVFTRYDRTFLDYLLASFLSNTQTIALGPLPELQKWQEVDFARLHLPHPKYTFVVPVEERTHETEKYQNCLATVFRNSVQEATPQIVVPESISAKVVSVLATLHLEPGKFVACMPAGTQNVKIKNWPEDRFAEVMVWLYREYGLTPLLVGLEEERHILEKVAELVRGQSIEAKVWVGKPEDLVLLAGLLEKARVYVGNDSGPMHLSAALGVPTLGIFGGGTWPRFTPVGANTVAVVATIPCFYCNWDCIFDNAPCLSLVTTEHVKRALEGLLSGKTIERVVNVTSSLSPMVIDFACKAAEQTRKFRNEAERRQEVIDALSNSLAQNSEQKQIIEAMRHSMSWRLTAPLRKVLDFIQKIT